MKRRTFLAYALTSAGLPKIAAAQTPAKRFRVGWIVATSAATSAVFFDAFRAGLSDRGYVVGDNLILEARYGDGVTDRVPALTQELLRIPVDVIVTQGPTTWTIVKSVTTTPVVYVFSADPVEAGFAQSFARPGGNSTGLTLMSVELNGKRLELLREILPTLRRTAIIANPDHRGEHLERQDSEKAAQRLGITLKYLPVHNAAELETSFSVIASDTEAIVVFPDPLTIQNRQRILDVAAARRIPVISGWSIFAQSGALCTYGPRLSESYRRAAYYVDRILKGVSPGDLPIERPTVFELVVNLKTAKALGLTMPEAILARADEVIE
jgi:putative tryptophan/tyrosine transport system substrate-binding protein